MRPELFAAVVAYVPARNVALVMDIIHRSCALSNVPTIAHMQRPEQTSETRLSCVAHNMQQKHINITNQRIHNKSKSIHHN